MPVLAVNGIQLSGMRVSTRDSLFPKRPHEGRDSAQLPVIAIISLHNHIDYCSEEWEVDSKTYKQYSLLDIVFRVYGMVGSEEPCRGLTKLAVVQLFSYSVVQLFS